MIIVVSIPNKKELTTVGECPDFHSKGVGAVIPTGSDRSLYSGRVAPTGHAGSLG
jgi:hypothetical protein